MEEDRSCWECLYNKIGGDTFFGKCRMRDLKDIPSHIADKGCSKWKIKQREVEQLSLNV